MELWLLISLIVFGVISLTILILLISMSSIDPLEYGITINSITKTIGKDVYDNGRYFIGPFQSFIKFPASLQTIEFSDSKKANVIFFIKIIV